MAESSRGSQSQGLPGPHEEKQSRGQGLHKQLRKTRYCMFHLQGVCQFGDACAFAHTTEELQGVPDLKKTRLCRYKECKEKNCLFAHSEAELRSTDVCFKKSLCMWHQKGRCRNGEQCRFAHGASELRTYRRLRAQAGKAERDPMEASQSSSSSRTQAFEELRSRPSSSSRSPVAQPFVATAKASQISIGQEPGLEQFGMEPNEGLPLLLAELQQARMSRLSQGESRRLPQRQPQIQDSLVALSQNLAELTQELQSLELQAARQGSMQLQSQLQQLQLHVPATSLAPSLYAQEEGLPITAAQSHLRSGPSESDALEALNFLLQGPNPGQPPSWSASG